MNTEKKTEERISTKLNRTKNAGFTNPPSDYFAHFADNLPLKENKEDKKIRFAFSQNNWFQLSSLAVAALLLLALWIFVFDADIKKDTDISFTVEELMALSDFQNYNDDIIYSELASVSYLENVTTDVEVDAFLDYSDVSTDEIIDLYSSEDLK
ncbi:MAG: hypothetical protein J7J72_04260 [Bacteroidales bacterium]|nr:hypothetical protein [Bacteroidales bacterium]